MSWRGGTLAVQYYPLEKFKTQITNPPKSMSYSWSGNRRLETFPAMSGRDKMETKYYYLSCCKL